MSPSLIGDNYAKDLSMLPSFPGGSFVSNTINFLSPDDVIIYRLTETTYDGADFDHIAVIEELGFHSSDFISDHIDELREDNVEDEIIVQTILNLDMVDDSLTKIVARFAYDNFLFKNRDDEDDLGKQIRGAYVGPEYAGAGLAGQVYRQLAILHRHLVCDNTQTTFGAALWAGTVRNVAGRVDIYNAALNQYVEELDNGAIGVNGCVPWDIGKLNPGNLGKWAQYPFNATINHCYYLVLIISA
ncbi:hypothetical protein [Rouxiella sp. WC2420]|uniref:N-acetyltransferase domain-containing protein n=1 Tax=Rouxiella sp. WC2420 TaxID=3234145 RepID=A0AB39VW99_9GAMM